MVRARGQEEDKTRLDQICRESTSQIHGSILQGTTRKTHTHTHLGQAQVCCALKNVSKTQSQKAPSRKRKQHINRT